MNKFTARAIGSFGAGFFGAAGCWAAASINAPAAMSIIAMCTIAAFFLVWVD